MLNSQSLVIRLVLLWPLFQQSIFLWKLTNYIFFTTSVLLELGIKTLSTSSVILNISLRLESLMNATFVSRVTHWKDPIPHLPPHWIGFSNYRDEDFYD